VNTLLNTALGLGTVVVPFAVGYATARSMNRRQLREAQQIAAAARLAARSDALTGLTNRTGIYEELQRRVAGRGHFAVLLLDLDGFKTVNDTLGPDAGDVVLATVADRLRGLLGGDGTAARLGGDEFVAVTAVALPVTVHTLAYAVARRVNRPVEIDGRLVKVSGSVGAVCGTAGDDVRALLRSADVAMYQAKSGSGHGGVAVYDATNGLAKVFQQRPAARLREMTGLGQDLADLPEQPPLAHLTEPTDVDQPLAEVTS
jgi:diguanylate cyclase (GGDEF)-like protein